MTPNERRVGGTRMTSRRLTVQEAAEVLGTSVDAVRMRVRRGSLESEKDPDGRVHVWVNGDSTETKPRLDGEPSALISAKDETISTLREQLQAERQAHAEARRLLAAALERIPAIEAPQEPPEDAETVEDAPEGAESHSAAEEARDELGAERVRREVAETTLREGMSEERRRREEAERERDGLRRELFALRGREASHEAAEGQQGRGQPQSATGGAQAGAQRPWWRRMFRG
jgi:excisionase family DNA binding protein